VEHKKEFHDVGFSVDNMIKWLNDHQLQDWIPDSSMIIRYESHWLVDYARSLNKKEFEKYRRGLLLKKHAKKMQKVQHTTTMTPEFQQIFANSMNVPQCKY